LFLEAIGMDLTRVRFRQHLETEMAHYAEDCWDLEVYFSGAWIECAGHADRACYDLTAHAEASGVRMQASKRLPEAKEIETIKVVPNKALIGKTFKRDQADVNKVLNELVTMMPDL